MRAPYISRNTSNSISSKMYLLCFELMIIAICMLPLKGVSHTYFLSSVVVHHGLNINGGHYVTFAKNRTDWYLYDDAAVCIKKYNNTTINLIN